jgi:3-oxoacyl-[acyl-carrier-protein] synthase-3
VFQQVSVGSVVQVEPPVRLTSAELARRLEPARERLGVHPDVLLEEVAGIRARRLWPPGTRVADAAALAGRRALVTAGVPRERVGLLVNTSVSREHLEPSTASLVHAALGLGDACANFDVANACLGFLTGMDVAGRMIEHGAVEYALVVDAEVSGRIIDRTVERLNRADATVERFREELASLTLGSAAAAMVLGRRGLLPDGPRFHGTVSLAATEFSDLCRGDLDRMVTDSAAVLEEGLRLAARTYRCAVAAFGWGDTPPDEVAAHQVGRAHTDGLVDRLGLDPDRVLRIYPERGNIGPAGLPVVLAELARTGRLHRGSRVALMGIGSGLNCSMADLAW